MAKKVIQEDTTVDEGSAAAETLHPGTKPAENPKSRYETLSAMIGAAATMKDEHLTKWYNDMIASTTGSELSKNIDAGAAAKNAATLAMKSVAKEDLDKIFDGAEELSEDFKTKASTLFEAALESRIALEVERLKEEISEELETEAVELVEAYENDLNGKVDEYLNYVAAKWLEENEVAITSSLHKEISEDFMAGLKDLFAQHYISIPEEKVDVVEELSTTVDDLENKLNELIAENAELKIKAEESARKDIVEAASAGLTVVEQVALKDLAKNVDASDLDVFKTKVETLKESHFVKDAKRSVLNEQLEEVSEDNAPAEEKKFNDPQMKNYVEAISRTVRR